MTDLYIKEVCSRLPYNTLVEFTDSNCVRIATIKDLLENHPIEEIITHGKLILYPLSEISDDVRTQLENVLDSNFSKNGYFDIYDTNEFGQIRLDRIWLDDIIKILDIIYSNHIDYNGLISSGQAKNATSYFNEIKFNAYELYK